MVSLPTELSDGSGYKTTSALEIGLLFSSYINTFAIVSSLRLQEEITKNEATNKEEAAMRVENFMSVN